MNSDWQQDLEIIGEKLFLQFRKRLMSPGISFEILRLYPGASLLDVMIRVHAGRRLIREGNDFLALRFIRDEQSPQRLAYVSAPGRAASRGSEFKDGLVLFGAVLFGIFCGLSLGYAVAGNDVAASLIGGLLGMPVALAFNWARVRRLIDQGSHGANPEST